jgi:hypothetical protein
MVNGQAVGLDLAALALEAPAPHFSAFPITSRRRLPPVGKGGPKAQPEGPRSALPPTKAAGTLPGLGKGSLRAGADFLAAGPQLVRKKVNRRRS